MNRKERRAAGKRGGGPFAPQSGPGRPGPDALTGNLFAAAVAHFRAGRLDEAERTCRDVLTFERNHAHALHLLGLIAFQSGRHEAALDLIGKAIALDRRNADCEFNIAQVLRALGRFDEAATHLTQATELRRDHAAAHLALADLHLQQGRFAEAAPRYRRALALQSAPAEAHSNFGVALAALGQWDEAAAQYRRALALKPDLVDVYRNLGRIVLMRGNVAEALALVRQGLARRETDELRALLVQCAKELRPADVDSELRDLIARALTEGWSRPSELSALAGELCEGLSGLAALAGDRLLVALLQSAPIRSLALERILTDVRAQLLQRATAAPAPMDDVLLGFFAALAQQCFINEYVFTCGEQETAQAQQLQASLAAAIETGGSISPLALMATAAYAPLHSLAQADSLLQRSWPAAIAALLEQQVREPLMEREIRPTIPSLTAITDAVSLKVLRQYEEMPYPRWLKAAPVGQPATLDWYLRSQFPAAPIRPGLRSGLEGLIAGCGTGQHAIETAQRFAGARVLAVDLSRTSLGYAIRKTRALGLGNIDYAQADLLQLGSLACTFDLIEAVGVLHHLRDWAQGWRALLALLRPGGFMHVGLYSALARADISAVRAFIAERGYGDTADDIRRCRQDLLRLDEGSPLRNVAKYADFFTTSECRDLLFHVQEHQLTIPEIAAFLREQGLVFLGFTGPAAQGYRARFPHDPAMADLEQWHRYETEQPTAFTGMYQFWVQKP